MQSCLLVELFERSDRFWPRNTLTKRYFEIGQHTRLYIVKWLRSLFKHLIATTLTTTIRIYVFDGITLF